MNKCCSCGNEIKPTERYCLYVNEFYYCEGCEGDLYGALMEDALDNGDLEIFNEEGGKHE